MDEEENPPSKNLNILLTYLTYFNDSKFNHIVIFATVLFGQFQIKELVISNKSQILLLSIALAIYLGITVFGIYEIFRIKFYVRRTIEFDTAIRLHDPTTFSVQKIEFKKLMGPALILKARVLDHTWLIIIIYLATSVGILFIS